MNQMLKPKLSNPSNKITGRKVEGTIKPKLVVHENRAPGETDQIFMMMSKINPSQNITPNKIKKKKKKKNKKAAHKIKTEVKEILKSGMKQSQKRTPTQVIPWGVNQQRLKNYILAEQEKYYNAIQRKNTRTTIDIKERRQQLGTSFLNQLCNKNIKLLKKKSIHGENQPKSRSISQWLKPKNLNFQMNKMKMSSIHYSSPAQKFQKRNRSLSQGQARKPAAQKNRIRTASLHEKTASFQDCFQQKSIQRKNQNQKKILIQYQNENQKKITEIGIDSSKNDSIKKPQSSIQQLMSNHSSNKFPNDSDPEQNIQDLDDSFYSQKVKLETQQEDEIFERRHSIYENDVENLQLSNYNYFKKEQKMQRDHSEQRLENLAALLIQKVWRGYQVRKMQRKNKKKFFPHQQNPGMNLNSLTKSQINKLIKFGYLKRNSTDIQQGLDESSFLSQSRPISQNEQQKDIKQQKEGNQYKKFIENFSDESNLIPSLKQDSKNNSNNQNVIQQSINLKIIPDKTPEKYKNSQANSDEQYLSQILQKSRKISQLSIDVEDREEENKVDIGEIRCAFGSESLVKSLSQEGDQSFTLERGEQSSYQDFLMNKFKEFMQREKMDQLISLREEALRQRQQQTIIQIDKALQSNKISPRTFEAQSKKIEKWVTKQVKDLEQKKKDIIKGQQSAFEAILKTQRDMQCVRQILQTQNSQTFIQLIDSLSQESANYSESSLKNSVIDIQNQNNQLNSLISEEQNKFQEEKTLFQKKNNNNILEEKILVCPDQINLKKMSQSFVVRQIDQVKEPSKISEKSADSYSILISNMLIQDEVNSFYIEMQGFGIDLYEVLSKSQRMPSILQKEQKIQGMKTNSLQIKSYLKNLEDFILDNAMMQVQRVINFPLGPSSKLLLKYLQPIRDSQESSDFDSNSPQHPIILSAELFGKFERYLMDKRIINHQNKLIIELEHIHNKAIYDSLNEALDQFRPYGLNGQPFLWKPDPQRLKPRENQLIHIPEIIRKASEKVVDWSHYMAGIIFDKEDSPFPKIIQIDQETKAQIREDRLYRMLTLDILDNDEKWTNYDEETAEVSIDLSDLLFDHLLDELVNELTRKQ